MLPLKQSSRTLILEVARALQPQFSHIHEGWRRKMRDEFAFDERTLAVLERLNLPVCYPLFRDGNFEPFFENLTYFGTRLAKLQVDTRAVARSLEFCQAICERHLQGLEGERRAEAVSALETLSSATFVTVSGAYFDSQKRETAALLSVLDAELTAGDLQGLLDHVLKITTATFNANLGFILLRDSEADTLRPKATTGVDPSELREDFTIGMGQGFSGQIALTGEPAMLPDLECCCVLDPFLRSKARSLWGVPLKNTERVIGVLMIGFSKPYEWLPTEKELMRAIADRSALAIDRAGMTDALKEREARIAELSAHLLKVQEDERKRISRELHDETGQSLMVIRLYLGMLENSLTARTAKGKVRETVTVVDRTIEGIRRIIGRLSPLVLQELGLIAAIRKEAKDLAKSTGVKARVAVGDDVGRLAPEIETAFYRVVQEALHNVAKHSQAKSVNIQMSRDNDKVTLLVEDDGVGITRQQGSKSERQSFGLAGIKERIGMLGGKVQVSSAKGKGTRIEVTVPIETHIDRLIGQVPAGRIETATHGEAAKAALANGTMASGD
jgi:signal transduction histidine kinase